MCVCACVPLCVHVCVQAFVPECVCVWWGGGGGDGMIHVQLSDILSD